MANAQPGKSQMVESRLARVETQIAHIEQTMTENRKATAHEITILREDMKDKIDEVVQSQARAEHDLVTQITQVSKRIDHSNTSLDDMAKTLSSISQKLSVHAAVFAIGGALSLAVFTSYMKSAFDRANSTQTQIHNLQRGQDAEEVRQQMDRENMREHRTTE